jgi:hypothetical protein
MSVPNSKLQRGASYASEQAGQPGAVPGMTAWVGLVVFGGIMLVVLGLFHLMQGAVALFDNGFYHATPGDLVIVMDYTVWGWLHIGVGVVAIAAGMGIFLGRGWARFVGVVIAGISALGSMVFLPAYPLWSTILIAVDVLVIYALLVHGREVRN